MVVSVVYCNSQFSDAGWECRFNLTAQTNLEPLRHIRGTYFIVLISHMTAFQLTGLVDLEDAAAAHSPLCLLLWSIPCFIILILLFLLSMIVCLGVKLGKVKVTTKNFLGLL